jgi:hypothetical protein
MQPDSCSDFEFIKAMLLQVGYYTESKECIAFVFRINYSRVPKIQEVTNSLKPCSQV